MAPNMAPLSFECEMFPFQALKPPAKAHCQSVDSEDAAREKEPSKTKPSLLVDYSKGKGRVTDSSSSPVLKKQRSCRDIPSSKWVSDSSKAPRSQTLLSLSDHASKSTNAVDAAESKVNATFSVSFRIRKLADAAKILCDSVCPSTYENLQKSLRNVTSGEEPAPPAGSTTAVTAPPRPGDLRLRFAQSKQPSGPETQGMSRRTALAQGRSPSSRYLLDSLQDPDTTAPSSKRASMQPRQGGEAIMKSMRDLTVSGASEEEDDIDVAGHSSFMALNAGRAPRRRSRARRSLRSFTANSLLATCEGKSEFVTGSIIRRGGNSNLLRNATR